jgi:hypothetical protein
VSAILRKPNLTDDGGVHVVDAFAEAAARGATD